MMNWNSFVPSIEGTWPPMEKPVLIRLGDQTLHVAALIISPNHIPVFHIDVCGIYGKQTISIAPHDVELWSVIPE